MGTFAVIAQIAHATESVQTHEVRLLLDAGAAYTMLPAHTLQTLGYRPEWSCQVRLANGQEERWEGTEIRIVLEGRTLHTPCLFGPADSLPLLGAVTLEAFHLGVDPLSKRLVPVTVPMARLADTTR
jgi:predicted aspartyl protease